MTNRKKSRPPHTYAQEMQVITLSRDHCQREIGEIVDISKVVVHSIQRKYHLVLAFGAGYHSSQVRHRYDAHLWRRILTELYVNQGLAMWEVAERCGLSRETIANRMKAVGVKRRNHRECVLCQRYGPGYKDVRRCACGAAIQVNSDLHCAECKRVPSRRRRYALKEAA